MEPTGWTLTASTMILLNGIILWRLLALESTIERHDRRVLEAKRRTDLLLDLLTAGPILPDGPICDR